MRPHHLYLTFLGGIFDIAFISYYVQYPALSSTSGIEPCERIFRHAYPNLYEKAIGSGYVDVDSFVELVCLAGIISSTLIASGLIQHGSLLYAISVMYDLLYKLGGSFYTFQWDILLLETGFLTALCFAPWKTLRLQENKQDEKLDVIGAWPLQFLLFKLMLMSGVVKIQAECPTWQNLTALEYHFATQCLPGPFAWHAHQLHPLLLRLGVAATFLIEIPAAFLLICPISTVRRVGAWLQILLQVLIIGTGNYNFFNLLTIALCLPCMMDGKESISRMTRRLYQILTIIFLGYWCFQMFELYQVHHPIDENRLVLGLKLTLTKDTCNEIMDKSVPVSILVVFASLVYNTIQIIVKEQSSQRRLSALAKGLVCSFGIVVTAKPLYNLTPSMQQPELFGSILNTIPYKSLLNPNGYGLFRRMTGVGRVVSTNGRTYGWAGPLPSVVARPEIIVEAVIENEGESADDTWHELKFRWKPGNVSAWPRQVAPHQPRFDWRMWFAALGSYHHNPWFISFIDKILNGCPVVLDLLEEPLLISRKSRVVKLRANLYKYDFTRLDTEWARGITNASILNEQSFWSFHEEVWTRRYDKQYLPELDKNNPSVQQYLRQTGLGDSACKDLQDRCEDVTSNAKWSCNSAVMLRRWNRPCLLSILVLALCLACKWAVSSRLNRSRGKVKID